MVSRDPDVSSAYTERRRCYFERCRRRVPGFVDRHFRYPGAWNTNRRALGWDLLRAPANLLWAPFYVAGVLSAMTARRMGRTRLAAALDRLPSGLATQVQRYVQDRIERELLALGRSSDDPEVTRVGRLALDRYASTRTASADIGNSLVSTLAGAVALKQFTPGGIAIGLLLGGWLAQRSAAADFFLGETVGSWYYGLFPPDPTLPQQLMGVLLVLVVLAIFAALSGLLTDPLQSRFGLHQHRINRMLEKLEADLASLDTERSSYRPPDPYLARLLEAIDAVRGPFL